MNLQTFVSGSAVVLMGWLVLSFQHQGTPSHYPKPTTASVPAESSPETVDSLISSISPSP